MRSRVLLTAAAATVRPLTTVLPLTDRGVRLGRWIVARSLSVCSPPVAGSELTAVDEAVSGGLRVRGEWVRAAGVPAYPRESGVVLYVHGSGYAICSARTHRGLTSRVSATTGLPVFACDYRLAPRHRFPAAADDVRAAYGWLLEQSYEPEQIVLAGDSAGGHLAVDLVCELARGGERVPRAMVLFSPLIDPTLELSRQREQHRRDPLISAERARRLLELYSRDIDPTHPRLRLAPPEGCAWPPTLVQAGAAEMLAADAEHLAEIIRAADGACELQLWPEQAHVFQAFAAFLPEARAALAKAGQFTRAAYSNTPQACPVQEGSS